MSITELKNLVPPPPNPIHVGDADRWTEIGKSIGIELPSDYFDLCAAYGSGEFLAGPLEIENPFNPDYRVWVEYELNKIRRCSPDDVPFPIFPDANGLFPFGRDDNGNRYYWLITMDRPWPIVCGSHEYTDWESVDYPITEFLTLLLKNELEINYDNYYGDGFDPEDMIFEPRKI